MANDLDGMNHIKSLKEFNMKGKKYARNMKWKLIIIQLKSGENYHINIFRFLTLIF